MNCTALILCAGMGTRLRPLTDEIPKPLVPVGDQPLLFHIIHKLEALGISQIALNVHYLESEFSKKISRLVSELKVFYEPEILGTAGGIAHLATSPDPVLVWNGDVLADPPVEVLLDRVKTYAAVLAVHPRPKGGGTIGLGSGGQVVRLRGHRFGDEVEGGDYVGIAALAPRALQAMPRRGCWIGDYVLPALQAGVEIGSVQAAGQWWDVGSLEGYRMANHAWLERNIRAQAGSSWVASTARIGAGVQVTSSIVGAGAQIEGRGGVSDCIVWPGACVVAPQDNVVITSSGQIVPLPTKAKDSA